MLLPPVVMKRMVQLIMLNMLLAIVMDVYTQVIAPRALGPPWVFPVNGDDMDTYGSLSFRIKSGSDKSRFAGSQFCKSAKLCLAPNM